jgi:hemolysin III
VTKEPKKKFSILRFVAEVLAQCGVLLLVFRFAMPGVWHRQVAAGIGAFIVVFLAMHLLMAFFEWFFHRYVLHSITTRWLVYFARGHRSHHGLTPIKLQPAPDGGDRYILNRYPITEEEQYEDSAFPVYATVAFWLFFTPLLIVLQLLVPAMPILLGGYAAITWSMLLYEVLHAIEHQPYDWWKHATENPRFGAMWRALYGFHHMHHANIACNEAIGGFFGLPIPDWLLGTYHQPKELLLEGRIATAKDFAVPPPTPLVRWMDRWARKRESEIHRR